MNFTDQYIKMCDCDEVQAHKKSFAERQVPVMPKDYLKVLYIPYQHDLQSLIFQYGSCQYKLLTDFYEWCKEYRDNDIDMVKGCTLEELWLMFYMWRDHQKIWNGEKWVKEQ